jgi:hypothetical protein
MILDSHPNVCCGPESKLFMSDHLLLSELAMKFKFAEGDVERLYRKSTSRAEFIDQFAELCCQSNQNGRWAEKTPRNILHLNFLFTSFPNAKFLHVLRDGRDVVCSLRTHPRFKVVGETLMPLNTWNPIEDCVRRWHDDIEASRPYWNDERVYYVRYEDLVSNARETLERLMGFLNEPWSDQLLTHDRATSDYRNPLMFPQSPEATTPINTDRIGRWQNDLSAADKECFKSIAGKLLIELGYAENNDW